MNISNNIQSWITKGDHDLGTAQIVFSQIKEYKDTVCFHCQQAVEKYLKALLIHLDIEFKYKHSLIYLLNLLSEQIEIPELMFENALKLENFAVEFRYPNEIIEPTENEIEDFFKIVINIRNFVADELNKQNNESIDKLLNDK